LRINRVIAARRAAHPLRCGRYRAIAVVADRTSHNRSQGASERRAGDINMVLITTLRSLVRNDEGQDLLEYALLVALIALVAVGAITLAGQNVNTIFQNIAAAL